jgi:hypothetical protein
MKSLIKKFQTLWAEVKYKDAAGIVRTKFWLTGDIDATDMQAFQVHNGTSVQLSGSTFILQVRLAGSTYQNKSGMMLPRKSNSVELRPDTRTYVDLGSMLETE